MSQHPAVAAFLAARQREEQSSSQVPEFFPLKSFVQLYIKANCSMEHFCKLFYDYLGPLSAPPDNGKPYFAALDHYDFRYLARFAQTSPKIVQQVFMEIYYDEYRNLTDRSKAP